MNTEMTYRRTFAAGASPIGLMIALFDTLAGNLRRAAAAIRKRDIETRCKEVNHAVLVLGQLENWLDIKNGGESATNLKRFYTHLRGKMIEASAKQSPEILEAQLDSVLHIRSAWQQLDDMSPQAAEASGGNTDSAYAQSPEPVGERLPLSLSV